MTMYRRGLVVLLVVALLLPAVIASAQGGEGGLTGTVNNFLQLYVVPNREAYAYARLDAEAVVTVIGRTNDNWAQVATEDGLIGWGRANALTIDGDYESLPVTAPGETQGVVLYNANLRQGPAYSAAPTGVSLEQGTICDLLAAYGEYVYAVTADGAGWTQSRALAYTYLEVPELPAVDGYASGYAFVRALPERNAYTFTRLEPGTPFAVVGRDGSGYFQVETLDGSIGWVMDRSLVYLGDAEALPVTAIGAEQAVVTNFATLYASPELGAESTGVQLDQGAVVNVVLMSGNWAYIEAADGSAGWTRINALAYVGGVAPADVPMTNATITPTENVDVVNLRAEPNAEAARLGWAAVGERLSVEGVSADGEWYYVIPASRVGAWVYAPLITLDAGVEVPVME